MRHLIHDCALTKTCIVPGSYANSAQNGTAIELRGFQDATFVCSAVNAGAGDTAFKLQASVDSAFTTPLDITGATSSILNADNGKPRLIRLPCDSMHRWVRVVATPTVTATFLSVVCVLENPSGNMTRPLTQDLTPVDVQAPNYGVSYNPTTGVFA